MYLLVVDEKVHLPVVPYSLDLDACAWVLVLVPFVEPNQVPLAGLFPLQIEACTVRDWNTSVACPGLEWVCSMYFGLVPW